MLHALPLNHLIALFIAVAITSAVTSALTTLVLIGLLGPSVVALPMAAALAGAGTFSWMTY